MAIYLKNNGVWKSVKVPFIKNKGVWKTAFVSYKKYKGVWKPVYSGDYTYEINVDRNRCTTDTYCTECVDACFLGIFYQDDPYEPPYIHESLLKECNGCMACVERCPEKAITLTKKFVYT